MSNSSHWAKTAREVIQQVRDANPTATPEQMRKLLSEAYPFGERRMHPYKVWLKEVRVSMGVKRDSHGKPLFGQKALL